MINRAQRAFQIMAYQAKNVLHALGMQVQAHKAPPCRSSENGFSNIYTRRENLVKPAKLKLSFLCLVQV